MNTPPRYLGEHGTQIDSIPKTGMSLNNKKTPDKWQRILQMIFCGGCLEINPEVIGDISRSEISQDRRYLKIGDISRSEISQDPVLNTKEVYLLHREDNPTYGEEWFMIQPVRLNSTER